MIAIPFRQQNSILKKEGYMDLPVYQDRSEIISCWQLNKEELEKINRTGLLWMRIVGGGGHPPIVITGYDPFRQPRPLTIASQILDRVNIFLEDDEELIILTVNPGQHDFRVDNAGDGWWDISYKDIESGEARKYWFYQFQEEVTIKGLGSELPEYTFIFNKMHINPALILVLDRVNKTIFDQETPKITSNINEGIKQLIENSRDCEEESDKLMQKLSEQEEYVKAGEYKVAKALYGSFAMRLQRLLDGESPFGAEPEKSIIQS